MTVDVWIVPVALVGLSVFLWAAAWLELLLAPRDGEPKLVPPEAVDAGFADASAGHELAGMDRPPVAEVPTATV